MMIQKRLAVLGSLAALLNGATVAVAAEPVTKDYSSELCLLSAISSGEIISPAQIYGVTGFLWNTTWSNGREQNRLVGPLNENQDQSLSVIQAGGFYGFRLAPDWQLVSSLTAKHASQITDTYAPKFSLHERDSEHAGMYLVQSTLTWRDQWSFGLMYNDESAYIPAYVGPIYEFQSNVKHTVHFWTVGLNWHDAWSELGVSYTPAVDHLAAEVKEEYDASLGLENVTFRSRLIKPADLSVNAKQTLAPLWYLRETAQVSIYNSHASLAPIERGPADKAKFSAVVDHDVTPSLLLGGGLVYDGSAYQEPSAYATAASHALLNTYGADAHGSYAFAPAVRLSLHGTYNYAAKTVAESDLLSGLNDHSAERYMVQFYAVSLVFDYAI